MESQNAATTIFEDCVVLQGKDLQPHWCRRLVVEDGIISEIKPGAAMRGCAGPCRVVMPAMVNAHTHIGDGFLADGATGLTLEEGFFRPNGFKYRELEKIDEDRHIASMVDTLAYMKRGGTIAHVDFREQGLVGARRLRTASEQAGVRSIILSQLRESPFGAAALESNCEPLPASVQAELRELLAIADGFSESTMNDLTDTAWRGIHQIASELNKATAIHCLENAGYREVSLARTGRGDLIRAIELLKPDCIVHLTVANQEEIRLLAKSGFPAVINPRANAVLGLPLPPVAALLKAGARLLLGTDNGMLNSPNLFAEMDFTYKLARSQFANAFDPDPVEILKMATVNFGASRWGADLPGRIDEGVPANIVVLDFSKPHLRHSAHIPASIVSRVTPADVLLTLHHGQIIYDAGA
jgi:cytosine/adenosine deaminase-related metal-dependent hydrolase